MNRKLTIEELTLLSQLLVPAKQSEVIQRLGAMIPDDDSADKLRNALLIKVSRMDNTAFISACVQARKVGDLDE